MSLDESLQVIPKHLVVTINIAINLKGTMLIRIDGVVDNIKRYVWLDRLGVNQLTVVFIRMAIPIVTATLCLGI